MERDYLRSLPNRGTGPATGGKSPPASASCEMDRLQDVRVQSSDPQDEDKGKEDVSERHQLRDICMIRPAPAGTDPLLHGDRDMPAVERQHRHEVDDSDEEVDECEKYEQRGQPETVELGSKLHRTEDRHDLTARGAPARA